MTDTLLTGSLLQGIPAALPAESFETVCSTEALTIQRIVSDGQASPPGFWYDQPDKEFVLIIRGSAGLRFEGRDVLVLKPGDYCLIGAHVKHRVEWTDPAGKTVWLAIHF